MAVWLVQMVGEPPWCDPLAFSYQWEIACKKYRRLLPKNREKEREREKRRVRAEGTKNPVPKKKKRAP